MADTNTNNTSNSNIITYDAIFELVRNEKSKEELIKTNSQIYGQIINYLKNKLELYRTLKSNESEAEKIKTQINNARKLIKEWYERREKKIALFALTKSRIKNIDESSLLPEEILMLNELTQVFEKYRQGILLNIVNLKKPNIEKDVEKYIEKDIEKDVEKDIDKNILKNNQHNFNQKTEISEEKKITNLSFSNTQTNLNKESLDSIKQNTEQEQKKSKTEQTNKKSEQIEQKIKKNETEKDNSESKKIRIRIFEDIPQFLGTNLEIYGPFKAYEIIELPYELAEVILRRKKGEQVE